MAEVGNCRYTQTKQRRTMPAETLSDPSRMSDEDLQKMWDRQLAEEGMPQELPPEFEFLEDASSPYAAATRYALERSRDIQASYVAGLHDAFARALANQFRLSLDEAREIVQNSLAYADRRAA